MGVVRAAVVFESVTGLSADRFVHDFWFRWDGPIGPEAGHLDDLADAVIDFYNGAPAPQVLQVAQYMSREVSRVANASQAKMYVMNELGQPTGSAALAKPFTLVVPQADNISLPGEVAVCLSVNADLAGVQVEVGLTRPQSRRRGRTYIGPLMTNTCALGQNVNGVQRPRDQFVDDLRIAYQRMVESTKNIMPLNAGLFASVYSPTDLAARTVVACSTDDAFDTQRRRGVKPTAKQITAVAAQ